MEMINTMDRETAVRLQQVGEDFCIRDPFFSYEEIKNGNVNHTYKVSYVCNDGSGFAQIKPYLVQRINAVAFRDPVALMNNIDRVTEYIRRKNPEAVCLHFHHTSDRKNYLADDDGFWRMSNFIPSVTYDICDDEEVIRSAGEAFGEFQMQLSDFDPSQLSYTIPDFHDTRKRYEKLRLDAKEDKLHRAEQVREELEWLFSVEEKACTLTDLYNAGKLPLRVTHNDTKINNVLFDEDTKKPLVVIDLDTVMPGLVGHDFGDAIRYAANFTEEDAEDTAKTGVNLNIFWAFAEGFLSKTAGTLTEKEIETLGISPFVLACELAVRFLDDYLLGDVYFKQKKPNHNLIRTRSQIALAKDMLKKLDAMNAVCVACAFKYR